MIIAVLDSVSFILFSASIIFIFKIKHYQSRLIPVLMLMFITITSIYIFMMFAEWANILTDYENIENVSGSLVPILFVIILFALFDEMRSYELSQSKQRLELILKGGDLGTWDYDIESDTLYTNELLGHMLGYAKDEIPQSLGGWRELLHPDQADSVYKSFDDHINAETPFYEAEMQIKDSSGNWQWILSRGKVLEHSETGKALRITGTHLKISMRKLMEEELKLKNEEFIATNKELQNSIEHIHQINTELAKSRDKAEESDRLKSAFLANLSHEIRTPMNGILGFAELLKQDNLPEKIQLDYIRIITQSGQRMLSLIDDLVNIARIEAGQIEIKPRETDLHKLLKSIHSFFNPEIDHTNIKFVLDQLPPQNESRVLIDSLRLEQILYNLIKNAIKFTLKGNINFGCEIRGASLLLYVQDTGCGIAEDMHEHIFERFRQADDRPFRSDEGSGLGLAISKALAELMHGTIWVESVEGEGSGFYVSLPYKKLTNRAIQNSMNKNRDIRLTPGLVLVAEDDHISFMLLNEILTSQNMQVIHATNGNEAVEMAKQHPEICLILMDVKMPLLGGLDATKQIRLFNPTVPIIAQTAYASDEDQEPALEAGCNDVVPKPIDQNTLKQKIFKLTAHHRENTVSRGELF